MARERQEKYDKTGGLPCKSSGIERVRVGYVFYTREAYSCWITITSCVVYVSVPFGVTQYAGMGIIAVIAKSVCFFILIVTGRRFL